AMSPMPRCLHKLLTHFRQTAGCFGTYEPQVAGGCRVIICLPLYEFITLTQFCIREHPCCRSIDDIDYFSHIVSLGKRHTLRWAFRPDIRKDLANIPLSGLGLHLIINRIKKLDPIEVRLRTEAIQP